MKKQFGLLFTLSLISISSIAIAVPLKKKDANGNVKVLMHEMVQNIRNLQPLMQKDAFADKKNEKQILEALKKMENSSSKFLAYKKLQGEGFRLSGKLLQEHIQETRLSFERGNKDYARWMLGATIRGCASCHAQGEHQGLQIWAEGAEGISDVFERAEFAFSTRSYDDALNGYKAWLENPTGDALQKRVREDLVFKRLMSIYLQNKREYSGATKLLSEIEANTKVGASLKEYSKKWMAELKALEPEMKALPNNFTELETRISPFMKDFDGFKVQVSEKEAAKCLFYSGIIYDRLNQKASPNETAQLLYWASKCERALNESFFFSMADLYLRSCVETAPKTEIAKTCFADLKTSIEFQYSGSRGTEIPMQVRQSLKRLEALLK